MRHSPGKPNVTSGKYRCTVEYAFTYIHHAIRSDPVHECVLTQVHWHGFLLVACPTKVLHPILKELYKICNLHAGLA